MILVLEIYGSNHGRTLEVDISTEIEPLEPSIHVLFQKINITKQFHLQNILYLMSDFCS